MTRKNIRGADFQSQLPDILQSKYRGELLSSILMMEKKSPISFAEAIRIIGEKHWQEWWVNDNPDGEWYLENFVKWISDQGYHIELTGDEFEPAQMSDKLS